MDKNYQLWRERFLAETKANQLADQIHRTAEGIEIDPVYSNEDWGYPGLPPFRRGPRASMYCGRPWTIRQYAGFSTADESNEFYRKCLAAGQTGLSVAFDLPTHRGYDSDHRLATGDVGKAGVAIDTAHDMTRLFQNIPLNKVSVSMTMNGAVLPVLAFFFTAAKRSGVSTQELRGTIQNDILKEYLVRNTYIYPPEPSMRIIGDIIQFLSHKAPKFNSVSISGYHMQEAGADSALELAYTVADGLEYVRTAIASGLSVDDFAPRLSFFFGIGMNFFMEIAKLRAARQLWFEVMQPFGPKNEKSAMLRTHCQTSGYSLAAKDPYNNIVRTTVEAMAACLGGTQSLHTNAFDEAIALPSDLSSRIARNTQLILRDETDITTTADPFGGSIFMESLTDKLLAKAKEHLNEIEALGGMTRALASGLPAQRIEEAAAIKQGNIDSGKATIVGVNKFQVESDLDDELRFIDQAEVLGEQSERLQEIRQNRDTQNLEKSLTALRECARTGSGNLLELSITAAEADATLGEISGALEDIFGRYEKESTAIRSVYGAVMTDTKAFHETIARVARFRKQAGRNPRVLVAKLGQDGHDRGAKIVASGLADLGFDVDLGSLFQMPAEVVKQAVENDVHVIGISTQAGAHNVLVPELVALLKEQDCDHIKVVVGGIIPNQDCKKLLDSGVGAIFHPGDSIVQCANTILDLLGRSDD